MAFGCFSVALWVLDGWSDATGDGRWGQLWCWSIVIGFRPIVRSVASIQWSNHVEYAVSTHVASTFYNASQPNRGTKRNGFRHGIQHSILHAVTKAESPFNTLGGRCIVKQHAMDRRWCLAERHFCDGCPDRRPCVFWCFGSSWSLRTLFGIWDFWQ
jgi:hypothetical protein